MAHDMRSLIPISLIQTVSQNTDRCKNKIFSIGQAGYLFTVFRREITGYGVIPNDAKDLSKSRTGFLGSSSSNGIGEEYCWDVPAAVNVRNNIPNKFDIALLDDTWTETEYSRSVISAKERPSEYLYASPNDVGCAIFRYKYLSEQPTMKIVYRFGDDDKPSIPSKRQLVCLAKAALISLGFAGATNLSDDEILTPDAVVMAIGVNRYACHAQRMLRIAPVAAAVTDLPRFLEINKPPLNRDELIGLLGLHSNDLAALREDWIARGKLSDPLCYRREHDRYGLRVRPPEVVQ